MKKVLLTLLAALLFVLLLCACSNGDIVESKAEKVIAEESIVNTDVENGGSQEAVEDDVPEEIVENEGSEENAEEDESVNAEEEDLSVDLGAAQVGDIVKFGSYEQDNNDANGKEDIEWIVLASNDGKLLLISKYALDGMAYHSEQTENITWSECEIRSWLNDTFVSEAFDDAERAQLVLSEIENPENSQYGTGACENTNDTVFLLSLDEAGEYFADNDARKCYPTEYAKENGAFTADNLSSENDPTCWWWLRSAGSENVDAASINYAGYINDLGFFYWMPSGGVRPAVWVTMEG